MKRTLEERDIVVKQEVHEITKLSDVQHILYASDMYIGQTMHTISPPVSRFVYNQQTQTMEFKEDIVYPGGLLKIFDEAIVNAADNVRRGTATIKIGINRMQNAIYIWNDGPNFEIKLTEHDSLWNPSQKAYQSEIAFFHCKSSSAYTKTKRVTGGKFGVGIKCAAIFSKQFTVEMCDGNTYYYQKCCDCLSKVFQPVIRPASAKEKDKPYIAICFSPDLSLFYPKNESPNVLPTEMVDLFMTRALDLAGTLPRAVRIFWSLTMTEFTAPKSAKYERLPVKGFKDYVRLFLPKELKDQMDSNGDNLKIGFYSTERWQVCMIKNPYGFPVNVSFANNINTYQGGSHLHYIQNQLLHYCRTKIEGIDLRRVAASIMLFVNATIEDPSFNSQCKESLKTSIGSFGSTCELPPKFFNVLTKSGVLDSLKAGMEQKELVAIRKNIGATKSRNVYNIPNFRDARFAGTRNSHKCILIIVEGVSALALAEVAISVLGNDYVGAFPIKGKIINGDVDWGELEKNEEFVNLCRVLGLQVGQKTERDQLRYNRVILMCDQDLDGSHIRGLLLYLFSKKWPHLLTDNHDFIQTMITPIVAATKKKGDCKYFYTLHSFDNWHSALSESQASQWDVRHLKGLGSSTNKQGQFYFNNLRDHLRNFVKAEEKDISELDLVFGKKNSAFRKSWIENYNQQDVINYEAIKQLTIFDFLHKDMIHFSMMALKRGVPHISDGMTPAARKCVWVFLQRNIIKDTKVCTAQSWVDADSNYHHAPDSLGKTIVRLSQNFTGKQNINLFLPIGQFGTRLDGGQSPASSRYLFTRLSPITRFIFRKEDDAILEQQIDEGNVIEPVCLEPIIPLILANGANSVAPGYKCVIGTYKPEDLIQKVKNKLLVKPDSTPLSPWYHKFQGVITTTDDSGNFQSEGICIKKSDKEWHITELPLGKWREPFKEQLTKMVSDNEITEFVEQHRDENVCFEVKLNNELKTDPIKYFKLKKPFSSQLNLFSHENKIASFKSITEIFDIWFDHRLNLYEKRRKSILQSLQNSLPFLVIKAEFIRLVLENRLPLGKKKDVITRVLLDNKIDLIFHERLLKMNLASFTEERIQVINSELLNRKKEIEYYDKVDPKELWLRDLADLETELVKFWSERISFSKDIKVIK